MPIEIERKFLVSGDGWRARAQVVPMAQGYLNDLATVDGGAMNASVRVRIEGDEARLNLKSRELGASRQEFDYRSRSPTRARCWRCAWAGWSTSAALRPLRRPPVGSRRIPRRQRRAGGRGNRARRRRRGLRPALPGSGRKPPTPRATTIWPWPRARIRNGARTSARRWTSRKDDRCCRSAFPGTNSPRASATGCSTRPAPAWCCSRATSRRRRRWRN